MLIVGNFDLSPLQRKFSAIRVIGYTWKRKEDYFMLRKTLPQSPKIQKYAQSQLKTNAQHLLPTLRKQLPTWKTSEQDGKHAVLETTKYLQ